MLICWGKENLKEKEKERVATTVVSKVILRGNVQMPVWEEVKTVKELSTLMLKERGKVRRLAKVISTREQ